MPQLIDEATKNRPTYKAPKSAEDLEQFAKEYPDVFEVKQIVLKILKVLEYNYNCLIHKKLHEGMSLPEAHALSILEFLNIEKIDYIIYNKILAPDPEDAQAKTLSVEQILSLIPLNLRVPIKTIIFNIKLKNIKNFI